jgi:hypothetical protein
MADFIHQTNAVSYFVNKPVSIFRTYSIGLHECNHWDFGGRYLESDVELETRFEFLNQWAIELHPGYQTRHLDTRLLRGGEAILTPPVWRIYSAVNTDNAKMLFAGIEAYFSQSTIEYARDFEISPEIIFRPVNTLRLAAGVSYSQHYNQLQYIRTISDQPDPRYILGTIDQQTLGLEFRIDYIITPELSVQYYGSPFVSQGQYTDYKKVTNPVENDYASRFEVFAAPVKSGGSILLDDDHDALADFSIPDPDFNFLQFRSNLVIRWEYRPGSTIFLVWSMDKTGGAEPLDLNLGSSMKQLGDIYPDNIFLVKFNYWFSL